MCAKLCRFNTHHNFTTVFVGGESYLCMRGGGWGMSGFRDRGLRDVRIGG